MPSTSTVVKLSPPMSVDEPLAAHRLPDILTAGLRRQILIGVCETTAIAQQWTHQLQQQLPAPVLEVPWEPSEPQLLQAIADVLVAHADLFLAGQLPTLVLTQVPALTQQPPLVQERFVRQLRALAEHLPEWEFNLLLWVNSPWLHQLQRAAPEFWRWHTGIFRVEGQVLTPPSTTPQPYQPLRPATPQVPPSPPTDDSAVVASATPLSEPIKDGQSPPAAATPQSPPPTQLETPAIALPLSSTTSNAAHSTPVTPADSAPNETGTEAEDEPPRPDDTSASGMSVSPPRVDLQQVIQQYRARLTAGDSQLSTLDQVINASEQWLTQSSTSASADLLNDLGNFYWMRSRHPANQTTQQEDLTQALQYYEAALTQLGDPQAHAPTYAMLQNNLGAAYGAIAQYENPIANLQCAIQAYETSLQYRTADTEPEKYSSTQNNLGTAYWQLSQRQNPAENLQAAIAAYNAASTVYEAQADWPNWAMIRNNLGTAYWQLAQLNNDRASLETAIACYRDSLQYRTAETAPAAYAATQNNMAAAYWYLASPPDLPAAEVQTFLGAAIAAYDEASRLGKSLAQQDSPVFVTFDWSAAYHNLGVVRYQFATEKRLELSQAEQLRQLEQSVVAYTQALMVLTVGSEAFNASLMGLVQSIRTCYALNGIDGQNRALSHVPSVLLPHLLPQL